MVEVSLTVGKLDASLALLLTKDHHLIEFPTILLPDDAEAGSVVKITCEKDSGAEKEEEDSFQSLQKELLETYGTEQPKAPVLSAKNITQTSVVLEWEPIEIAQADIKKLVLLRDGVWCGHIPNPLVRTATKLSGFGVEKKYTFQLVLYTTAGTYESNLLEIETHSMTDLRGITVCLGEIDPNMTTVTESEISESLEDIHAKPLQNEVKLDTTHFVCTKPQGAQWEKAVDMNIPVVLPEWLRACKMDKKMVNVRNFYLDSDPKHRSQYKRAPGAPASPSIHQAESIRSTEPAASAPESAPVESAPVESTSVESTSVESTPAAAAPVESTATNSYLERSNTRHSIFTEGATEAEEVDEDPLNVELEKEVAANDAEVEAASESMAEVDLDGPSGEPDPDTVEEIAVTESDPVVVAEPEPEPEVEAETKAEDKVKEPEEAVTTDAIEPETKTVIDLTGDDKPTEPETEPEPEPESENQTEPESKTTPAEETKPEPETVKSPSQLADEFAEVSLEDSKSPEDSTAEGGNKEDDDDGDEDGDEEEEVDDKQEDSKPAAASGKKNKKKNKKKGKK
ncbi:hypothetical protein B0I72DRAFT_143024 [Yarrowia lipolytica]|jgi:hypothetical protein|uniref:Chitin biosynthesis protein CHS5 n=1 Tax=Yarrowia lipolytica (strain CLIB 122 / E 150) TaxID=284591 RepID=Q6C5Q3_YARLI|nr:YALI0E16170p [Yarrowia lipolytica CLIB122]RDW29539.1 hypothetical protein B0I72DRAFT_143024 [Yarrowia lipolytica]RDW39857.1 hypothetical protein B0I73DRAFT_131384 [Yarrowia lipolytica]RDW46240.1 hypothetical protein B0I74DRAFT_137287 [Yarrowia lipolytica]RDW50415.1 hypothetical protein B0I75DRAFT_141555 [Yarrowia lipolytica]CAG79602.1 YALI0E16170p [Yarrowia lipolytica CLIB122]|eukprot:XP_504009.1 YALI0E16170p [Yarrowia lipolytica CLIB122]